MKTLKIIFLVVAFALCIGSLFAQGVNPVQPAGDGTITAPYQIANLANLRWLSQTQNATAWGTETSKRYYIQTADIDATETSSWVWNGGQGFSPIGGNSVFYGDYDGRGFSISNLYISRTNPYIGLFGYGENITLKDINLIDVNIIIPNNTSAAYTGGLVGVLLETSNIENCSVSGSIFGKSYIMGGIVASAWGDITIVDCSFSGTISGEYVYTTQSDSGIGGLAGISHGASIVNCSVSGTISSIATDCVGGLFGWAQDSNIQDCSARVNLTISHFTPSSYPGIGGFIGFVYNCSISNSFFYGDIVSSETQYTNKQGGFIGYLANFDSNASINNSYVSSINPFTNIGGGFLGSFYPDTTPSFSSCYFNTTTTMLNNAFGTGTNDNVVGLSDDAMKVQSSFVGWDFTTTWDIDPAINNGYPYLLSNNNPPVPPIVTLISPENGVTNQPTRTTLQWQQPAGSVTGYKIYLATTPMPYSNAGNLAHTINRGTTTSWQPTSELTIGATYYWQVVAFNEAGDGQSSFSRSFTTFSPTIPPAGTGTETDPYQIADIINLRWLSETQSAWGSVVTPLFFIQTANIDASVTRDWNGGLGFSPIGNDSQSFWYGSFDGQGFYISNLYISRTDDKIGLFGYIQNSVVSNVRLVNVDIARIGNDNIGCTGSLVARVEDSIIMDCSVSGSISGRARQLGGLIGASYRSDIQRCSSTANISTIDSYALGGLIGYLVDSSSLSNSFFNGSLINITPGDNDRRGGLVGDMWDNSSITYSYVSSIAPFINIDGGFTGMYISAYPYTGCYFNTTTTGKEYAFTNGTNAEVTPLDDEHMKMQDSFIGWDFTGIWAINPSINGGYPYHVDRPNIFDPVSGLEYNQIVLGGTVGFEVSRGYCTDPVITIPSYYPETDPSVGVPVLQIAYAGFQDFAGLQQLNLEGASNLRSISVDAFSGCANLQSVTMPTDSQLNDIGYRAFEFCSSLQSIVIPSSVAFIQDNAFAGCTELTILFEIYEEDRPANWLFNYNPDGCPEIWGYLSIDFATMLRYKELSENNEVIGYEVSLGYCTSETVIIPRTYNELPVLAIADLGFVEYGSLQHLILTDASYLQKIGESAFGWCTDLQTVLMPRSSSITTIDYQGFAGCSSLPYIIIPASVTYVGENAFWFCDILTIYCERAENPLPNWHDNFNPDNRPIVWNCFYDTEGLLYTEITLGDIIGYEVSLGECTDDTIAIPDMWIGLPVISIADAGFANNSVLKYVDLREANNLRKIGAEAFSGCENLLAINMPAQSIIETIDSSAFSGCEHLQRILIPASVTEMGNNVFASCDELTIYTRASMPPANWGNYNPDGRPEVPGYTLDFDYDLQTGLLYELILATGTDCEVSRGVTVLTEITLPATFNNWSVVKITDDGFLSYSLLENVTMANSITEIGHRAFKGCISLSEIQLSNALVVIGDEAFSGCVALHNTGDPAPYRFNGLLPDTLTRLGNYAFANCESITSITIPSSVTEMGDNPFVGCSDELDLEIEDNGAAPYFTQGNCLISRQDNLLVTGFSDSSIPDFIVTIGNRAFFEKGIVTIVLPETLRSIKAYAFASCGDLTGLELPPGIEEIDKSSFSDCISLETVTIPDRYRNDNIYRNIILGESIFEGCVALTSVELPESFTTISARMFYGCSSLTTIDLSSMTSIGEYAFSDCSSLTVIVLLPTIEEIDAGAFSDCISLETVTIPNRQRDEGVYRDAVLGDGIFDGCTALRFVELPTSFTTISPRMFNGLSNLETIIFSPEMIKISEYALAGCSALQTVELPPTVDEIDTGAFSDCISLETVTVPNRHRDSGIYRDVVLGESIFEGCVELVSVELPECFTTITARMFYGCESLTTIDLSIMTSIGAYAFSGCASLTGIELPPTIEDIDAGAFSDCISLETVIIPNRHRDENIYRDIVIGDGIFEGCIALVSVDLGSISAFSDRMFYGCISLPSIDLSSAISIGAFAFAHCEAFEQIELPPTIVEIDAGAFSDCISLETVTVPNRQRDGDTYREVVLGAGIFEGCMALVTVELPDSFTSIGAQMFSGCESLTDITISESITEIGERAFEDCSDLPTVVIPLSVVIIGSHAFAGCSSLTIYAVVTEANRPSGWANDFNPDNRPIVWDYLSDEGDEVITMLPTKLKGNYPNPFNPSTTISFDLARDGHVIIEIYNVRGQRVKEVVNGSFDAGSHKVIWNGDDSTGRTVGSGVYFYRMTAAGYTSVRKMLLMK